ncbi:MAG: type II secretion system protein GspM [Candidatus Thiodiazotropha sp.]|jgi:hypothetical protein
MSTSVRSTKQCNLLFLGFALFVLLAGAFLFWLWSGLMGRYQETSEESRYRAAQFLRVAQRQEKLQNELESPKQRAFIEENYLTGEVSGVAYAALQQQINDMITKANGVVLSTQLVQQPQDEEQPTEKIVVRVRMQGNTQVLQRVMQSLEQQRPLLFFEQLSIQAPPKVKVDEAERLDIRFDVYGYFWKGSV